MGCSAVSGNVVQLRYLECLFDRFVGYLLALGGVLFFMMFIAGGYRYITSGGDPKNIELAQRTLSYALFGLIFIALAFLILRFIEIFTGTNVTNFVIFRP